VVWDDLIGGCDAWLHVALCPLGADHPRELKEDEVNFMMLG